MYTIFIILGLLLSSGTHGILQSRAQDGSPDMSGDGLLDIDNGSGFGPTLVDDEDVEDISGESSGSGQTSTKTQHELSTVPTTTRSLTACEQLRLSTLNTTIDGYKPKCTVNGEYEPLQCHRRMYSKECWCVDKLGNEITGSKMMQPLVPDCITGVGLKPCVFQLLKKKQGLLGVYHPRCTIDGEFEKIQCLGSACWCVDEHGVEQQETKVYKPEVPDCREATQKPIIHVEVTTSPTTKPTVPDTTPEPKRTTPAVTKNENNIYITKNEENEDKNESTDIIIPGISEWPEIEDSDKNRNLNAEGKSETGRTEKQDSSPIVYIMGRPGLLAAVIGGAVVTLLLTILLVMFIVYRMRKKDEGSYPLDEQKYTNYSYMKAPDKEFYA